MRKFFEETTSTARFWVLWLSLYWAAMIPACAVNRGEPVDAWWTAACLAVALLTLLVAKTIAEDR